MMKTSSMFALAIAGVCAVAATASADTIAGSKGVLGTADSISNVIVTNVVPFTGTPTTESFQVQDATGATEVFGLSTATYTPHVGDIINVSGLSGAFRGLFEMENGGGATLTASLVSSGNPVPAPAAFTMTELQSGVDDTNVESLIGTLSNVTFTTTGTFTSNGSFTVTDGTLTGTIFIPANDALIGAAIPTGAVNITGYMGEFDSGLAANTAPNNTGHELDALTITSAAAAPEPASLALLGLGAAAMITRRRRA